MPGKIRLILKKLKMNAVFKLLNFFDIFHFLSFNYATIIPFGCSISYDYVDVLLATTIGPIVIALMIWIASAVESYWYVSGRDTKEGRGEETQTRYYQYFLYLTYLVLPSVTVVIFGMFPCQNVDEQEEEDADRLAARAAAGLVALPASAGAQV